MTPPRPLFASTLVAGLTALTAAAGVAGASTPPSEPANVVVHAMGETEVPADPQRVVVLDSSFLDSAIALGVLPVGATEGFAGGGLPGYLPEEVLENVEIVGQT